MQLKNTFVQGTLNKDVDERLVPNGQYPDALNIRVSNTDGSDVGAVENVKGNEALTNLGLVNAKTIGRFADGSNQKIYWFITSDEKDLVVEYNRATSTTETVLETTDGRLGFNRDYLITGVVKIINGDSNKDLLVWTDDLNPPRCINIERAKTYVVNGFDEFDINLIKRPPAAAPTCTPAQTGGEENNLENKFYAFAYRYKYLDGEYSALSSFSNYQFYPSEFDLDFQTMENEGMVNEFNAIDIDFNTGDKRVTDIELVFKETNSNTVYLIETFNKVNEIWNNNETQTFRFFNNKINVALPESELQRLYDNVPRKAKALELVGTRLVFGNYTEQYDLIDELGQEVNVDYKLKLVSREIIGEEFFGIGIAEKVIFNLSGIELRQGTRLTFEFSLVDGQFTPDDYGIELQSTPFTFVLSQDYATTLQLQADPEFISFVENTMTQTFLSEYTVENPPADSTVIAVSNFQIGGITLGQIIIDLPQVTFEIDNGVDPVTEETATLFADSASGVARENAVDSSLKTNRSYEASLIYLDDYNRATTALTDKDNTLYIPQEFSTSQNKLQIEIKNNPPAWAKRYRIALKQDKGEYQTIYTNLFYEDGLFRWVKLEGANVNKVQEGDQLIVKSDLGGALAEIIKVRVLEVALKEANFISGNEDVNGSQIIEEAGLYMKIKPSNISMNFGALTARTYEGGSHLRYPVRTFTSGAFGEFDEFGVFTPFALNAGSRVRIRVNFKARGSIAYEATYDRRFRVNGNYTSVKEWFEAEVEDFGSFGATYTWNGVSNIGGEINCGFGQAETNNYISGYGFSNGVCGNSDSVKFYVVPHRKGTASRNITSNVKFEIINSDGILIFETEGADNQSDIFFETADTFEIQDGKHLGNIQDQNQALNEDAIIELSAFNCYVQGNGAESYRYKDAFNVGTNNEGNKILANYLNIDLRPTAKSLEKFQEVKRFADMTYSEPYNENTSINRINEFNLAKANFKDDIDRAFGFIQFLRARDTDLVVFQEDKVSKVLYGKDLLASADGGGNVATIEDVLGQQVPYSGEYGISRNPESFASHGYNMYFVDAKRGAVIRLGRDGMTEISAAGLRTFFRDELRDSINDVALGTFDPHLDQYVVHLPKNNGLTLTHDENAGGWTSRHSFKPDFMVGMNNEFYTFLNGDLYKHHSNTAPRNTYYGISYPSTITLMQNESPSDIKLVQAAMLEGNLPWSTVITTFITNTDDVMFSTIDATEYVEKEGLWYAYARRNEATHYDSKSSYGIGEVLSINPITNTITVQGYSSSLAIGDVIVNTNLDEVGFVENHFTVNGVTTIELTGIFGLTLGGFILGAKDNRVEGGGLRGYTIKIDLEIGVLTKAELFAVNTEVKKSYS